MTLLVRWILLAFLFFLTAHFVPGISVASPYTAFVLALLWGIVNITLKPLLVLLTLPVNLITLGLFTLVINALLFWLLSTIVKGFEVESFSAAFIGSLIVSLGSSILLFLFRK